MSVQENKIKDSLGRELQLRHFVRLGQLSVSNDSQGQFRKNKVSQEMKQAMHWISGRPDNPTS